MPRLFPLPLLLCVALSVLSAALAQAPLCPDSVAIDRCLRHFDRDGDAALDIAELESMLDNAGWYARWTLSDADTYITRCDADESGTISAVELVSSSCMATCAEQRLLYTTVC
jgi:hypothetical protein